ANGDTESPTSFYDPVANAFTQVPTSNGGTIWASPTYTLRMLDQHAAIGQIKHSQGIGWRCPNRATIGSWDLSERIRHRVIVIEARRRLGVTVCHRRNGAKHVAVNHHRRWSIRNTLRIRDDGSSLPASLVRAPRR